MLVFDSGAEREFDVSRHVEKILTTVADGDISLACWEPGQISPFHCHPEAVEIYLCLEGGGIMLTTGESRQLGAGQLVIHPPQELHEFSNGPARTILFRVRYGHDRSARTKQHRGDPGWTMSQRDAEYFGVDQAD